ncbi:MAG: uroporphyrinogen-III synthase [Bacteroidota bacterium]
MKIQNILISQPQPVDFEKSPYADIKKKHGVNIEFVKFFSIEDVNAIEFRKFRINILEHNAVIMMSKHAVDHYFRMAKELRVDIPDTMKYFCVNETTALYLQRYIVYRKRKIFFSKTNINELVEIIAKHKTEKYLIPTADNNGGIIASLLQNVNITVTTANMFRNVSVDLKNLINIDNYQLIVVFSPSGINSLLENYPDFNEKNIEIGALGKNVALSIESRGLTLSFMAPTPECSSITQAIDYFLKKTNKVCKK